MDKIYNLVINFYNNESIDYDKIKFLIDYQMKKGSKSFYIRENIFGQNHLSTQQRKKYYENILELMPDKSEIMMELDFDSINDYQDMLQRLEKYNKNFMPVIKSSVSKNYDSDFSCANYLEFINFLLKFNNKFFIVIDTLSLSVFQNSEILNTISNNDILNGVIIDSATDSDFDLNIEQISVLKEKLASNFKLIGSGDDFYYLNLKNNLSTISKFYILLPSLFKMIKAEHKKNNIEKSKNHQLELNDFITFIDRIDSGDEAFKFLLNKKLNNALGLKFDFEQQTQALLLEKFKKINEYIFDNN